MQRLLAVFIISIAAVAQSKPAADLIVTNAKVWTVDKAYPSAQAVAVLGDRIVEGSVLLGINHVDPAGDHGQGAGLERALMGRGIDPARETGDHEESVPAELGCDLAGEPAAVGRGIARAHHRDGAPLH